MVETHARDSQDFDGGADLDAMGEDLDSGREIHESILAPLRRSRKCSLVVHL